MSRAHLMSRYGCNRDTLWPDNLVVLTVMILPPKMLESLNENEQYDVVADYRSNSTFCQPLSCTTLAPRTIPGWSSRQLAKLASVV